MGKENFRPPLRILLIFCSVILSVFLFIGVWLYTVYLEEQTPEARIRHFETDFLHHFDALEDWLVEDAVLEYGELRTNYATAQAHASQYRSSGCRLIGGGTIVEHNSLVMEIGGSCSFDLSSECYGKVNDELIYLVLITHVEMDSNQTVTRLSSDDPVFGLIFFGIELTE